MTDPAQAMQPAPPEGPTDSALNSLREQREESETGRLEAFSDGVFAIAITLLILEIKVPHAEGLPLAQQLLHIWPSYLAYLASFFTIGVMWINHHTLFTLIGRVDHGLLVLNGLLLLGVTVVPFPTAVLAEHFRGTDGHVAAALYNGWFIAIALQYTWLWSHASKGRRLIARDVSATALAAVESQYRFGALTYALIFALGWISVPASIVLNIALAVWFGLPPDWFRRK